MNVSHPELSPLIASRDPRPSYLLPDAIFEQLDPVPQLIPQHGFYRGAVTLVAGAGYTGKTILLQSALLGAAAGDVAWGTPCTRALRALHVDSEQGEYLSRLRYQRLARGSGITVEQLGDRLALTTAAPSPLGKPGALTIWRDALAGFDLCVVDSLHAVSGGLDENDARARAPIDTLNAIAIANQQSIVLVHHTRKDAGSGSAQEAIRGSSAIFDAPTAVYMLTRDKSGLRRLAQHKDRYRQPPGALLFDIADGADDALVVTTRAEDVDGSQRDSPIEELVIAFIVERGPQPSVDAIRIGIHRNKQRVGDVVRELIARGVLQRKENQYDLTVEARAHLNT